MRRLIQALGLRKAPPLAVHTDTLRHRLTAFMVSARLQEMRRREQARKH